MIIAALQLENHWWQSDASRLEDHLHSIVHTIRDYREGELNPPTLEHVDQWIKQFDKSVQLPMAREIDHVLAKTYYSRKRVLELLGRIASNERIAGEDPKDYWVKANFLRIQKQGKSQVELLDLFDTVLQDKYGFKTESCGVLEGDFVYLDDVMFSGERIQKDLTVWIKNDAPTHATVHVIVFVTHKLALYQVVQRLKPLSNKKNITIKFWDAPGGTLENRKAFREDSEVLWPSELYDDERFTEYLAGDHKFPFDPRQAGGKLGPFSSEEGRQLLEREFTLAGFKVRSSHKTFAMKNRPLGFSNFGLGFGSMVVTYRNCPNTAPLALWWGVNPNQWHPLFERNRHNRD